MAKKAFVTLTSRAVFIAVSLIVGVTAKGATGAEQSNTAPSNQAKTDVDLLIVSADDAQLIPSVAALAGRLSQSSRMPALVVSAGVARQSEIDLFLQQFKPQRTLVLVMGDTRSPIGVASKNDAVIKLSKSITQASLEIAERFWGTTEKVVVVQAGDPSAVLLASALAGHMGLPLICIEDGTDGEVVKSRLDRMKVRQALTVATDGGTGMAWQKYLPREPEVLDIKQATKRLVRTVGAKLARNIIVARVPETEESPSATSPLAAYLSIVRRSPIALCRSPKGKRVESYVLAFVKRYGLKPETITLLGDHKAIGLIRLSNPEILGKYKVKVEPCSQPLGLSAANYGVGRIPQADLQEASLLIARGIMRPRVVGQVLPRLLMIANPKTANPKADDGTFPFAETVSRITAQEFKNLGLPIDEFYGTPSNTPVVIAAAEQAHVIVFEGHVEDQLLFSDPTPPQSLPGEDVPVIIENRRVGLMNPSDRTHAWSLTSIEHVTTASHAGFPSVVASAIPKQDQVASKEQETPLPKLTRWPLVILQSCKSMDPVVARKIFRQGGVGLLGTVTRVHSASGSAFAKAYCDTMLYHGRTTGQALRDARNYLLFLAKLKDLRDHKEQAKVYRAALSFQLWGDPETRIPLNSPARVRLAPISAKFIAADKIQITTPEQFLPECRTSKYFAKIFPCSQVAGIVGKTVGVERRRLMSVYFFVIPVPEGFARAGYSKLQGAGDIVRRSIWAMDSDNRNINLLYFPEKDVQRESITLRFIQ